jgi:Na+-driven multidrug efflux pump
MDDKRIKILKDAPIPNAVMTMALPAIIGMLVMGIYNMADTMFVSWLGTEATGAT